MALPGCFGSGAGLAAARGEYCSEDDCTARRNRRVEFGSYADCMGVLPLRSLELHAKRPRELIAPASTHLEASAALENGDVFSVEERLQFGDPIDVDDG